MDWYSENIEEPIRDLVRVLRNNGFNTESSCGHEMTVQCRYLPDGELQRLHNLLFEMYNNYTINTEIKCVDSKWYATIEIKIGDD